jgi:ferrochelatase
MSENMSPRGVLLVAFGGPRNLEEVEPFVRAITGGRPMPPVVFEESRRRYGLIGGGSPLPAITEELASSLERRLGADGTPWRVAVGTMYARPSIAEGISGLARGGVGRAVSLVLVPQYSVATVGGYLKRVEEEMSAAGQPFSLATVRSWATHPRLIEAFAEKARAALEALPESERGGVEAVFTAHSLPTSAVPEGDPFVEELRATAGAIADRVGLARWQLAFQSAGRSGGTWFGPSLEEAVAAVAATGRRDVLVAPIHFLADNIEILYDLDIALKQHADRLGVRLLRPESLNTSPLLVEALADQVARQM